MLLKSLERCIDLSRDQILERVNPENVLWVHAQEEEESKEKQPKKYVLAHKNNGSNVLAVVHIDTVIQETEFAVGKKRIFASKLDDRLGLYTILSHLPKVFGVDLDILITDNEESGMSTAQFYDRIVPKEYNWIVEFDRPGTDNVCYQFTDPSWCGMWEEFGFKFGIGSYTDIVEMDSIGVKAINLGVGYYDSHSINSYMVPAFYEKMVKKFVQFYEKYKDVKFPHSPVGEWNSEASATDYGFRMWLNDMIYKGHLLTTQINSLAALQEWYAANQPEGTKNEATT